jgi:hypothetical protein
MVILMKQGFSRWSQNWRVSATTLGAVLLLGVSGVPAAVAADGVASRVAPGTEVICPIELPILGSELDAVQAFLGDRYVDARVIESGLVIGVYGLSSDSIAGLVSCGVFANVVAYPVSVQDMQDAWNFVFDRLEGMAVQCTPDYANGTATIGVLAENLAEAVNRAQADPELRAMIDTPPGTADKVHIEFAEGYPIVAKPGTLEETTPTPTESFEATHPILLLPKVTLTPTTVLPGGIVQIALTNMNPNTPVTVELRPGGAMLADWVADANGSVRSSVTLPIGLAAGDYTLAFLRNSEEVGHPTELGTAALEVSGDGSGPQPRSSTDLAVTGAGWGPSLIVVAGLLLLAGVGVSVWRRRICHG